VVPGIENEENWLEHREGVLRDLEPHGHLEGVLAEQVASLLWRRTRVVRYEVESIAPMQEEVERKIYALRRLEEAQNRACFAESLSDLSDDDPIPVKEALAIFLYLVDFLTERPMNGVNLKAIPLPEISSDTSQREPRWSAGEFRKAIAILEEQSNKKTGSLLAVAEGIPRVWLKEAEREAEVAGLEEVSDGRAERDRILPDEREVEKIIRYEAHFGRELTRSLDQLKALQSARKAQTPGDTR
jgi:hypothetical protein